MIDLVNLRVLTSEGEGSKDLRVTVANTLGVVALARNLILGQVLHDRLVLGCLLCADLRCNVIAAFVGAVLAEIKRCEGVLTIRAAWRFY